MPTGITPTPIAGPLPTVILYAPLPNCLNPSNATLLFANSACGDSCGICFGDAIGTGWCISAGECTSTCTSNAQCPTGICLVDTGCRNSCYTPAHVTFCMDEATPYRLFKKNP